MAERSGTEAIISRLNEIADRLVSNKRFDELAETVQKINDSIKKLTSEVEAARLAQSKELKVQTDRISELEDFFRKELKKLRDEWEESAGSVEMPDPADQKEPPAWVKDLMGQGKNLFQTIVGDEEVLKAARVRVRDWVLKGGKKVLTGGDDE